MSNVFHQFFRDIIHLCIFQFTLPRLPYFSHPVFDFSTVSITTELIVYYSLLLLLLLLFLYWIDDILPDLDLPLTYSGFRDVCTGLANQSGQIMSNNSNEVMRIK